MAHDSESPDFEHDPYDAKQFRDERFAEANASIYRAYVRARVEGHMPDAAFRRAFGPGYRAEDVHKYAEQIEHNPWFTDAFAAALTAMPLEKLWNNKLAINALRQLTLDPYVKCSTRLAAMKELNILAQITFVDDAGRTRVAKSLDDFYASLPAQDKEADEARAAAVKAAGIRDEAIPGSSTGETAPATQQDTQEGQ